MLPPSARFSGDTHLHLDDDHLDDGHLDDDHLDDRHHYDEDPGSESHSQAGPLIQCNQRVCIPRNGGVILVIYTAG